MGTIQPNTRFKYQDTPLDARVSLSTHVCDVLRIADLFLDYFVLRKNLPLPLDHDHGEKCF